MWKILTFILSIVCNILLINGQPIYTHAVQGKRLFAYAGGAGGLVKIDMETFRIIKNLSDKNLGIVPILQIRPDGRQLYVTGDWFGAPLVVINAKTLEITRMLSEEGFESAKTGLGYQCRGKLSPNGKRMVLDCKFGPTPFALIDTVSLKTINRLGGFLTNPLFEAIFSDDSKLLYVLSRHQEKQGKTIYEAKIIILDAETGKVLKEVPLPELKEVKCNTNIAAFTGEKSNIYITCSCNLVFDLCVRDLLKEDAVYPSIPSESKVIRLIEVKSGKIINEIPIPNGRGEFSQITLTPSGNWLLIGRGGYRDPGELTIVDVKSKKVIARIMLEGGATSNVVFGYE